MMLYVVNVVMQIWIYGFDVYVSFLFLRCTDAICTGYESGRVWDRLHGTAQERPHGGNVHVMGITSLERRESLVDTRWKLVLHYRESGVAQGRGIAHGQGHWVLSRYCIARAHSKLEQNSKIFNTVHGVFTDSSVCGKKGTIHQQLETWTHITRTCWDDHYRYSYSNTNCH